MQEECASFSSMLVISMLYDMNMMCNLFGLIHVSKGHLVHQKLLFSLMQETTLYFLQQNRLHFILKGYNSKPIKWQMRKRHNKNC